MKILETWKVDLVEGEGGGSIVELVASFGAEHMDELRTRWNCVTCGIQHDFGAADPIRQPVGCEHIAAVMATKYRARRLDKKAEDAEESSEDIDIVELLTALSHEIWADFMRHLLRHGTSAPYGAFTINPDRVERWRRRANTDYRDLPIEERFSALISARKILINLKEWGLK